MVVITTNRAKKVREQLKAPPPWHSILLVIVCAALFFRLLPDLDSLDKAATVETFTRSLFPNLISLRSLVMIRASICLFMFSTQVQAVMDPNLIAFEAVYLPQSKLKRGAMISLKGYRILLPFTSWAWNLLCLSFGVNAWIGWKALSNESDKIPQHVLRAGILLFEVSAPMALKVAFVVRYGIWPQNLKNGTSDVLKTPRALLWHNFNVIAALCEASLLGGLPTRYVDLSVSALFGMTYLLFSWGTMHFWAAQDGPQFLYFFLDTTLGATTSLALVLLLLVIMAFHGLFCVIHQILESLGGGFIVHGLAVVVLSGVVCRFRD